MQQRLNNGYCACYAQAGGWAAGGLLYSGIYCVIHSRIAALAIPMFVRKMRKSLAMF